MTDFKRYLREYDGPPVRLMEVCGTHTAQISRCGIASMLSPKIRLVSGPGCPVCVTVTSYVDRLVELSLKPGTAVVSFGDMLRVRGTSMSLNDAKAEGGSVRMVYSPLDALKLAREDPSTEYVFAAVGFETTAPVYAMLLDEAVLSGVTNLKILTSLKTMPPVIDTICAKQGGVDGFLAPGHVSVITGSDIFLPLAEKYGIPFVVAGFEGEQILAAVYALVKLRGKGTAMNLYPSAVTAKGNETAQESVRKYFEPCDAAWRGIGLIRGSGIALRKEYARFDAGGAELTGDAGFEPGCSCAEVLTGALSPLECPLFGKVCTPENPRGACMVSTEGSCFHYYVNRRRV
jgi:hydrogenase expression/formation protein HypD